jgi:hypothetical protein
MFSAEILSGGSYLATDWGGPANTNKELPLWRSTLPGPESGVGVQRGHSVISFSGGNFIIVGFSRPIRQVHYPVPREVQVILIDAPTGRILGSREWSDVPASKVTILATEKGNFLLRDRRGLDLYSPTFEALKHIAMVELRQKVFEEWKVLTTPNHKFIALAHVVGPVAEIQWLLPESLAVHHSWALAREIPRAEVFPHISVSDERAAASWDGPTGCDVSVQDGPASWRTVLHAGHKCDGGVEFLDNDTLFVSLQGELQVLSVGGKLLWRQSLKRQERAYYVAASANARRFAVAISSFKGGVDLLDIASHEVLKRIEVHDSQTGQTILKMEKKLDIVSGFALSPDGLRLALLRGEIVELLQLSL